MGRLLIMILTCLLTALPLSAQTEQLGKWATDEFTTEWAEHVWEFDASKFVEGKNCIKFTYTSGAHKLCLKDVNIIADGKTVLTDSVEFSAGSNPKSAIYVFNLDAAPNTLILTANVRTAGGTNSNGTITGGLYEPEPRVEANSQSWNSGDFMTNWKEYFWEFDASSFVKGSNTITFLYTSGSNKLCLKDVNVIADGKCVLTDSAEMSAGTNPKSITYLFDLDAVPTTLTLTAAARTVGGTSSKGIIYINGVLYIPEGTTEIGGSAYYGNKTLKKVVIPSTVTKIGSLAFHSCTNLEEVYIPSSVTTIGNAAFQNDSLLTKVTLHEGLTNMPYRLFKGTAIREITIPSTVTEFGSELFSSCDSLTVIRVDKYSEAHAFFSFDTRLAFTDNEPVQSFEQWLSSAQYDILEDSVLYIKPGTTAIKANAYKGNTRIKRVVFTTTPTVTEIGKQAFADCGNLEEIDIPSSVTTIGESVFQNDSLLAKVTLHEGLTNMPYRLFRKTAIREITIPSTVTEFGSDLFSLCDSLTTIRVDKYTDAHAFFNTDSRMELTDKESVKAKEEWISTAKYNILDEGVLYVAYGQTKISDNQYDGRDDIVEIRFSETVEKIGQRAFRKNTGLKKVVIPGNVKLIADGAFSGCPNLEEVIMEEGVEQIKVYAFYGCPQLNSVTMPKSLQTIVPDGLYWDNKSTRVFHCYLGSEAYRLASENNYQRIDIIGVDGEQIGDIDLTYLSLSGNKTIKAGLLQNLAFERVDLGNELTEIGENPFHESTIIRVKRGTYGDAWAEEHGYYLCGVLADLNLYTKDQSKQIEEDFTRILCDDTPYAEWTSYKFDTQHPLKLEEVDGKLVLTSFMLYPCENVTVTTKSGETLISNKTIQPLSRTELCGFEFLKDSVEHFMLTTDDAFYQRLVSIPIKWTLSFSGSVRRTSAADDNFVETMRQVYAREYLAGIYNVAYIMGTAEYERRCYEAVENKTLVTNEELTEYLTKEQMEKLLEKTKVWTLVLGRDNIGGLGGGSTLTLARNFVLGLSLGLPNAFWHEFSHCMGWAHEQGNMCYEGRPEPFEVDWPSIGSILYQEEYKKGTPPYMDGKRLLNTELFSREELFTTPMEDDFVIGDTLYVMEGMPFVTSHKDQTDFSKVKIPSSVEVINVSAFSGTKIEKVELSSNVAIIKKQAFYSCEDLQSITLTNSVKEIGDAAFQNCTSLTKVEIPSSIRELKYRAFKNSGLTEITISSTVKVIGKEVFQDCKDLKTVVIDSGVRKIDNNAFQNTGIERIEVPESVTTFGKSVTSKNVVWVVKYGSAAFYYAMDNNYPIELLPEPEEEIMARIIADGEKADPASTEGWETGDFLSTNVRRRWDFSDALKGGGDYKITFKYTSGACRLCLEDALFVADGEAISYIPEMRSAGSNPRQIVYEITVPAGTEKLELYAFAKTGGGTDSYGTIKVDYLGGSNGIDDAQVEGYNIYVLHRTIVVENATSDICVYDISGRLVGCRDKACLVSTVAIPVPAAGIYIVETGGVSQKVLVE